MEPVKRDGKIREQIELENKIRRDKKWGRLAESQVNEFYNPNKLCREFRRRFGEKDFREQSGFWPDCRCGRKKSDIHVVKCLQKVKKEDYGHFERQQEADHKDNGDEKSSSISSSASDENRHYFSKIPETSAGIIGWPKQKDTYRLLERTTSYISPKYTMPGYRIDDKPYNHIFIG